MGWGTDFKANVFISRMEFPSSAHVDFAIEEQERAILNAEKMLIALAAGTPKDIAPEEWGEERPRWIADSVEENITSIVEAAQMIMKLALLKENFKKFKAHEDKKVFRRPTGEAPEHPGHGTEAGTDNPA